MKEKKRCLDEYQPLSSLSFELEDRDLEIPFYDYPKIILGERILI